MSPRAMRLGAAGLAFGLAAMAIVMAGGRDDGEPGRDRHDTRSAEAPDRGSRAIAPPQGPPRVAGPSRMATESPEAAPAPRPSSRTAPTTGGGEGRSHPVEGVSPSPRPETPDRLKQVADPAPTLEDYLGQSWVAFLMEDAMDCIRSTPADGRTAISDHTTFHLQAVQGGQGSAELRLDRIESDNLWSDELECFVERLTEITVPLPADWHDEPFPEEGLSLSQEVTLELRR